MIDPITANIPAFTVTPAINTPTFPEDIDVYNSELPAVIAAQKLLGTELNTFVTQANVLESNVNVLEQSASASALSAQGSANYQGAWTSKGYTLGQTVSDANGIRWLCKLTHTTAQTAVEGTYWTIAIPYIGAIGNINSPLLGMPLKNSLAMKSGVGSATFTRASTATYIDRYGVLKTAVIDEPRFEKEGYLNEGGSTNLLTYSEQFDNAAWNKNTEITITPNSVPAPNGELTADTITYTGTVSYKAMYRAYATTSLVPYTKTIFLKKGTIDKYSLSMYFNTTSNGGRAIFDLINGTFSGVDIAGTIIQLASISASMVALADGWYRCSLTINPTALGSITNVLCYEYPGIFSAQTNGYLYIFGAQLEIQPFATSYIPTVANAVTRAVDLELVTSTNNIPNLSSFSLAIDVVMLYAPTTTSYLVSQYQDGINYIGLTAYANKSFSFRVMLNGVSHTIIAGANQFNVGEKVRLLGTYNKGISKLYANGILIIEATFTEVNTYYIPTVPIQIGGVNSANQVVCKLSNLRIYDKVLTTQEVALA